MENLFIDKIWSDKNEQLCIHPLSDNSVKHSFEFIYRNAMGVYWNNNEEYFYHKTNTLPLIEQFNTIYTAVESEFGFSLTITTSTKYENISDKLKQHIRSHTDGL